MNEGDSESYKYIQFNELEKAMEDSVVLDAAIEAARRAEIVNVNNKELYDTQDSVDDNTKELDARVIHAIDARVELSGLVQFSKDGDETEPILVEDAISEFKGFIISRRNGRIFYDYYYHVLIDSDKKILSVKDQAELVNENRESEIHVAAVQAKVGDVYMRFDTIHPTRALAWLNISYPETVELLDTMIIGTESTTEEERLLALRNFSIAMPSNLSQEDIDEYLINIREYVRGVISIDYAVPYEFTIDGIVMELDNGMEDLSIKELKQNALFSVSSLSTIIKNDKNNEENEPAICNFGVYGMLHASDLDDKSEYKMIPLSSITAIRSLRTVNQALTDTSEK